MNVGIVGVGFMGWIHYLAYQRSDSSNLVGFASRDAKKRSGDWTSIKGNFGPPAEVIDVSDLNVHDSLDGLLADDAVEVVDICLPPAFHEEAIVQSLAAGKHVVCEKPLTLDLASANRILAAAEQAKGKLWVAHILPFLNEYRFVLSAVQNQTYGELVSMRLHRAISPPDWIPDFYNPKTIGGPLIDLSIHDLHFMRMLMGQPTSSHIACQTANTGLPKHYEMLFQFDGGGYASVGGGVINSSARAFTHGYEIQFEDACLQFDFAGFSDGTSDLMPLRVLHRDGSIDLPELGDPDMVVAFSRQCEALSQAVAGKEVHPALDPVHAIDALALIETISV